MKKQLKSIMRELVYLTIPKKISSNFIHLKKEEMDVIKTSLEKNYFTNWRSKEYFSDKAYNDDFKAQLKERLEKDRMKYIPWFNKILDLRGCRILEIGCGTGSSTVAFAEQGAIITGVDIDEDSLKVAAERCRVYNVNATFIKSNAIDVFDVLKDQKFDLVIFFACMEHMTYEERIISLKKCWNFIEKGKLISIAGTPNRLWYFDSHTSFLPFYHWLPDRIAFDYSKNSKRNNFRELYLQYDHEKFLHFLRRGRGFSFHEIEIALEKQVKDLKIVDHINNHFINRMALSNFERKYSRLISKVNKEINRGLFYKNIDIVIEK